MQGLALAKLLLIIVLAIHQGQSVKTTGVFVVSWLAGHCEYIKGKCDPNVISRWDHRSFTINGLWPSYQSYSQQYGYFDLNLLRKSFFFEDMKTYWPPQPQRGGKPYFLWELQWKDHGKVFGDISLQLYPQEYSNNIYQRNDQLQLNYFQTNLKLYKRLNLMNMDTALMKKQQLAKRMKISEKSFYFICTEKGILREIRICINFEPTGLKTFDCNRANKNCNDVITLKDWVGQKSDAQLQAQRQREEKYKMVSDQERQRLQAERLRKQQAQKMRILRQKKAKADRQNAEMQANWNTNKAKQTQNKPLSAEQKAQIDFYENQVSLQELDFDMRGTAIIILCWLSLMVLMYLCLAYLKNESNKQKRSKQNFDIQLSSSNSKRQDLLIKCDQP